ncbi:hypothetical protein BC828DRAFT_335628, partial [Blastocladiella britannica]
DFVLSQQQMDTVLDEMRDQEADAAERAHVGGSPPEFLASGLVNVTIVPAQVEKGLDCSVCMDKFRESDQGVVKTPGCDHLFHRDCIVPWFQGHRTCPTCRMDVVKE